MEQWQRRRRRPQRLALTIGCEIVFILLGVILCAHATSPQDVIHLLHSKGFSSPIYPYGTAAYYNYRWVKNSACNVLTPLVVARPRTPRDVSAAVRAANEAGLPLSVRSGGHGYTCNNLKNGSIHLDLRLMNKVELAKDPYSHSPPRFARLGPGSTWSRVLDLIPPDQYTLVHGQCTDVGVGGYLLGGGVNIAGSTTR